MRDASEISVKEVHPQGFRWLTLMSKGLGNLHRDIVAHLADPIMRDCTWIDKDETYAQGVFFVLADGAFDLSNVVRILAKSHNAYDRRFVSPVFQASFSRAVRSLVKRRVLEKLWLV